MMMVKVEKDERKLRCSTFVSVDGCWLINRVIYLKLRPKKLLLKGEKINKMITTLQMFM